jgi:chlorophyllide a reductase subunit X
VRPKPLTQDGLLGLFSGDQTGAAYVLQPATQADMRGGTFVEARSLEVVYDTV